MPAKKSSKKAVKKATSTPKPAKPKFYHGEQIVRIQDKEVNSRVLHEVETVAATYLLNDEEFKAVK